MSVQENQVDVVKLAPDQAELLRMSAAASLAGGIIAAAGRSFSMEEAMQVYMDAFYTLFPNPGHGRFDAWKGLHRPKLRIGTANEMSP